MVASGRSNTALVVCASAAHFLFDFAKAPAYHAHDMVGMLGTWSDRLAQTTSFGMLQVEAVNKIYPGRASLSPSLDLLMTLLHWGAHGAL